MKKIIAYMFLTVALVSCESFVTGIDEKDPTRPTDAALQQVYIAMEVEFAGTMEGTAARMAGVWSGYFTGTDRQYIDIQNYNVTAGNFDDPWGNMYTFTMAQIRIVQEKGAELGNTNAVGAAQVLEAYTIGTAAALWGDVPYTEAVNFEEFPNPAYDPQSAVIDDMISLLDDAIANLTLNIGTFPGELLGGTTSAKWIKAANTLKARYLLYKKDYAGAAAAAALGITTTADHIRMIHGTTNNVDRNIYYDFMVRQRPGYMGGNSFLRNMMGSSASTGRGNAKTNDGPRRSAYYASGGTGTPNTGTGGYFASNATFPLLTSWENNLIWAEADALATNSISAAALTALNAHRAIMQTNYPTGLYTAYASTDFDATTGIENDGVDGPVVTPVEAFVREVRQEKYVSMYGMLEVFNEIRRTNNPFGLVANVGTTLPQRFLYAQDEVNSNSSTPNPIPALTDKTTIFQ